MQDKGEDVLLTVTQKGFGSKENQEHSESGWSQVLQKIKDIAETL